MNPTRELLNRGPPLQDIHLTVIQPAQYEIGRLWQENRISVAQEHLATAISQLALSHRAHPPGPREGPAPHLPGLPPPGHDGLRRAGRAEGGPAHAGHPRLARETAAILSKHTLSREVAIARIRDALSKAGLGSRMEDREVRRG